MEFFEAILRLRFPRWDGEILNLGLPSETVSGLSEPGHKRPGMNKGLPLAEAQAKAAEITRQIGSLLPQL